jgi:signal transduction histidine kinase
MLHFSLLLIALMLGAGLVASAIANYRDAVSVGVGLAERQGVILFRRLALDPNTASDRLRAQFERALAARDVTYLSLWQDGALQLEVGQSNFVGLRPTPGEIQLEAGHARMSFSSRMFGPTLLRRQDAAGNDLDIVVEFDSSGTMDFARRALLSLWLACGVALLLTLAATIVWRLGARAQQLQHVMDQQRHLATLGTLSAVMAHELRNPLTALKGNAQLLAEDPTGARAPDQSRRLLKSVHRLESVVNDLLDFARCGTIRPALTSPARVLEAAVGTTHPDVIDAVARDAPERWWMDGSRIQQVLVNLLENAVQATPAGHRVTASAHQEGDTLVYTVRDRGVGIAPADRERIFEPFYTTRLRGTGLGLAIARRIVELHGGRIDADDPEGGGARLRVVLPAAK